MRASLANESIVMKIHEYQAKALFKEYGIRVPEGRIAQTPAEVKEIASSIKGIVAVKSQVHVGGRGKAGGIKIASNPEEAESIAGQILGMDIKGIKVRKVLVEPGADIAEEAYLGIIVDRGRKGITFICSAEGGVEIEEIAATHPEKILHVHAFARSFPKAEARGVAGSLFHREGTSDAVLDIMERLFTLFVEKDCTLAEINPLVVTRSGDVVALDGKINFDDNALEKHEDIVASRDLEEENANEIEAHEKGLSYVELEGNIGCMVNGAGLAMATMDMIKLYGGEPANFLDVGGSSNPEKVVHAFRLILRNRGIRAIMINIFGGITRCDDIAKGILASMKQIDVDVPIVVRLSGTNAEEGRRLLENTTLIPAETFAEAVQKVVELSKGSTS